MSDAKATDEMRKHGKRIFALQYKRRLEYYSGIVANPKRHLQLIDMMAAPERADEWLECNRVALGQVWGTDRFLFLDARTPHVHISGLSAKSTEKLRLLSAGLGDSDLSWPVEMAALCRLDVVPVVLIFNLVVNGETVTRVSMFPVPYIDQEASAKRVQTEWIEYLRSLLIMPTRPPGDRLNSDTLQYAFNSFRAELTTNPIRTSLSSRFPSGVGDKKSQHAFVASPTICTAATPSVSTTAATPSITTTAEIATSPAPPSVATPATTASPTTTGTASTTPTPTGVPVTTHTIAPTTITTALFVTSVNTKVNQSSILSLSPAVASNVNSSEKSPDIDKNSNLTTQKLKQRYSSPFRGVLYRGAATTEEFGLDQGRFYTADRNWAVHYALVSRVKSHPHPAQVATFHVKQAVPLIDITLDSVRLLTELANKEIESGEKPFYSETRPTRPSAISVAFRLSQLLPTCAKLKAFLETLVRSVETTEYELTGNVEDIAWTKLVELLRRVECEPVERREIQKIASASDQFMGGRAFQFAFAIVKSAIRRTSVRPIDHNMLRWLESFPDIYGYRAPELPSSKSSLHSEVVLTAAGQSFIALQKVDKVLHNVETCQFLDEFGCCTCCPMHGSSSTAAT